jgi:DNA-binding protein YbaB
MSEHVAERILEIRDQADRLGQAFEDAASVLGPTTGSDESGTVTVDLDRDGNVAAVRVDADWRQHHTPEELSAAVLAAMGRAVGDRMGTWAQTFVESAETHPERATRPLPVQDDFAARVTEAAGGHLDEAALVELIGNLDAALEEANQAMERLANANYSARSTSGHVRARCHVSGQVLDLAYDQRWLETAHSFNIGRETTEAVTRAHREATATSLQAALEASSLGRLQKILNDPEALGRALRRR